MYSVFAAELMIWSIACMAKLKVMNSTIGFKPPSPRRRRRRQNHAR
jgi:hypothetical protein